MLQFSPYAQPCHRLLDTGNEHVSALRQHRRSLSTRGFLYAGYQRLDQGRIEVQHPQIIPPTIEALAIALAESRQATLARAQMEKPVPWRPNADQVLSTWPCRRPPRTRRRFSPGGSLCGSLQAVGNVPRNFAIDPDSDFSDCRVESLGGFDNAGTRVIIAHNFDQRDQMRRIERMAQDKPPWAFSSSLHFGEGQAGS